MIRYTNLKVGDVVPMTAQSTPLSDQMPAQWFITVATPQHDTGLIAYFRMIGAVDAWRPTTTRWRPATGPRKRVRYEASVAPGYVFVLLDAVPRWHVIRDQAGRLMRGVVGRHGEPMPVDEAVMAAMRQVPERIEVLRNQAEKQRQADLIASLPRVGGKARVNLGGADFVVDVDSIDAGILRFIRNGIRGSVRIEDAVRLDL